MARRPERLVREGLVRHLPKFRRFALSLARNQADADDLVQAGIERALARAKTYNPDYKVETWVFKIIQNHWTDQMRKRARRGTTVDIDQAYSLAGEDGRRSVEIRDLSFKARLAIEQLPEDHRSVVALILVNGESYKDAAEILGIPVGTVMSRLYRARKSLVEQLENDQTLGGQA
ncbi:MAG: RNA polymerase sigma factor [Pseudomonadota bacterium]|jgi:RNA polymerase sigma-70 factor (ECF subfamily)|nr:RNA polymerase sigma factor [Pseudomonadota bacterium]